jgi:hypothetical protein
MISIHTIWTIARYEMRTLLRAWFFRIFAAMAIFMIGVYNLAMFIEASGAPWIYRALPAALPYASLIILNLGQAIVAVFLASEFLKQDRKNDTVEVIYARSMTNGEYIFGKALGVLAVFFVLNLIILFVGIGFSFLNGDSSRGVAEFFVYPLLISLPTLVYVIGLSFFLMVTLKNQAITFILLLGYIALSVFYLNNQLYNLPDFIAYNVPMLHSTICGFGQFNEILLHRGIYFCLGLGLIFFTIHKLERLPQAGGQRVVPLIFTIVFILLGGLLGYRFIDSKNQALNLKSEMLDINDRYIELPSVYIDSCQIDLKHHADRLDIQCRLVVSNRTNQTIDTLILSLNPSLKVLEMDFNGLGLKHERHQHVVKAWLPEPIVPGKTAGIHLSYKGTIDGNTHFLDNGTNEKKENFRHEIFTFRKNYAWLQKDYVCLTSGSLWYPVSGVTWSRLKPDLYQPDFTLFELKVDTDSTLMAVSQGRFEQKAAGNYHFYNENPLPQLSILIGNYQKLSLRVDSVEYSLIVYKGNNYFSKNFEQVKDSLPFLIRELKNEYETQIGFKYPFKRFSLVETPAEFATDIHIWSISSNAVQPEMVLIPEKGIFLNETDFRKRQKREEERMKRDNEEVMPEELQARVFKKFVRSNFMAEPDQYFEAEFVQRNTYSIFPLFFGFVRQLHAEKWPILNTALNAYIKERQTLKPHADFWWGNTLSIPEQINLQLKQFTLKELIYQGISKTNDEEGRISLNDLILAKGEHLFSLLRARNGDKAFDQAIDEFLQQSTFSSFRFSQLDSALNKAFGKSITDDIEIWYNQKKLSGYLIKDIENYKVRENDYTRYQIRFKVSNLEPVDGFITILVEMAGKEESWPRRGQKQASTDFSKMVFIPGKSSKEIGFVFPAEPARMKINAHISENLPGLLEYDFLSFDEVRKSKAFDSVMNIGFFDKIHIENEYIVDNEDIEFKLEQKLNESYLKSLIKKISNTQKDYKYARIRSWNPPGAWKFVLHSDFYGKYIRSAVYTKAGSGDRKASWNATLQKPASYDVYCHMVRITNEWQRNKEQLNYRFKVHHAEGVDDIQLFDEDIENGWVYLGTWYFSPGMASVELNNQTTGNMVFADAVKWVMNK